MAQPDLNSALRVPGSFWVSPTDVSGSTGTQLGEAKTVIAHRRRRSYDITAEEYGGEILDELYMGEEWWISASFRGLDSDMVIKAIENATAASASEPLPQIQWPDAAGTMEGVQLGSAGSFALLFVPADTENHHAVYFRTCVARAVEELQLAHSRAEEQIVAVLFRAFRDGTTPTGSVQVKALEDIVL